MAIDSRACAEGPDLRKSRPTVAKVAGLPVHKKAPLVPRSLAVQPAAAAAAALVRPTDLPMVFAEAVAVSGRADAHVIAEDLA
jgi:hypothetical protein